MDANAASMAEVSRRADRRRTQNALFVIAAAERPPAELLGRADLLTITMPWGSLLRGALGRDEAIMRGVAALLNEHGRLEILLSVEPRDGLGEPDLDDACRRWAAHRI